MTLYQAEDKARLRRERAKQAISLALEGRWDEAVEVNRDILEAFPDDVESYNRLGKALLELGQYAEARKAFAKAIELSPYNTIAKKNLARLSKLPSQAPEAKEMGGKVSPRLFIAETGKTGVASLTETAPAEVLAKVVAGDPVDLEAKGRNLQVFTLEGEYLGQIEPRLAFRLLHLIEGGNRYAAAITAVSDRGVKVIIKETYCHPSRAGKVSFPAKKMDDFRPYVRGELLHFESEEEEERTPDDVQDWEDQEEPTPEEIPFYRDRNTPDGDSEEESEEK